MFTTAVHYAESFVAMIFYFILLNWAFRYATRKNRARRLVEKNHPTFFILTDEDNMSEALKGLAEYIKVEYKVEPKIVSKLPHDAGANIVTIEEVGPANEKEIFVEHIDSTQLAKVECKCKNTSSACCGAITQVLAA